METNVATTAEIEIQLDELINEGKFEEASHLLNHHEYREIFQALVGEKSEKLDFKTSYKFCKYVIESNETDVYWHKMAFNVAHLLSEKDIAFRYTSLEHLLQAIAMDPTDWKLKERALDYFAGGVLPEKYVKPYAEIVIRRDPTNRNALRVLESEWDL